MFESISDTSLTLQHCVMAVLDVESALSDTEPHLFQGELGFVRAELLKMDSSSTWTELCGHTNSAMEGITCMRCLHNKFWALLQMCV